MQLGYSHLNLTRNPFGEATATERMHLAVADVDAIVESLRRPGFAVQFLGDRGRGKTSHLLAIRARLAEAPYLHIGEGEWPRIPHGHPLLLDETQRLPAWRRWLLFRRGVSFAIGSHQDHEPELVAAGLDVITIRPGEETSLDRLETIVTRRIEWARRGPGPVLKVSRQQLARLQAEVGDDVRAIEGRLYEVVQRAREIDDVGL